MEFAEILLLVGDDALAAAEILKLAYNKVGPERLLKEVKNLSTPKKAKVV